MPNGLKLKPLKTLNRRQLLKIGLAGLGIAGAATLAGQFLDPQSSQGKTLIQVPPLPDNIPTGGNGIDAMTFLRHFDYGTLKRENGRMIREFKIKAQTTTIQLNSATSYITWNYNGQVPGPTLRAKEGERVRVLFLNQGGHAHSMHFHGDHPAEMDGIKPVSNDTATIYEFDAKPFGVHLYHCHIAPVTRHISKGLYGMFIIDPPGGRPPADELVMIMGGYDLNEDGHNELYAFNGIPDIYMEHPIPIQQDQLVRLYLLNMVEFDAALTFHIHANLFQVYRTGRTLVPTEETDVITMGTAERHILEFRYPYPGKFMFHPHQDFMAENGCMGNFEVVGNT